MGVFGVKPDILFANKNEIFQMFNLTNNFNLVSMNRLQLRLDSSKFP